MYAPDVYQFMPTYNWDKLAEVFDTAWTASAFKGAHGPTLSVPPMEKHIANTLAWINVMKNEAPKFSRGKNYFQTEADFFSKKNKMTIYIIIIMLLIFIIHRLPRHCSHWLAKI